MMTTIIDQGGTHGERFERPTRARWSFCVRSERKPKWGPQKKRRIAHA